MQSRLLPAPLRSSNPPVDGDGTECEHAGGADEQVEQGGEVAPHHAKHPLPLERADGHKRQHQQRQQQVGQRQAEDKLVAGRQQVRPAVQGDHDEEVAQAGQQRDGHDGDRLQGHAGITVPQRGAVPAGVHGCLCG